MNFLQSLLFRYALHLTFFLVAIITFLSLYPVEFPEVPGNDKTMHFVAYAACVLPACIVRPKNLYVVLLFIFFWSGLMEIIQPYVNRHGDWLDLVANTGGMVIGFLAGWMVKWIWVER